MNNGWLRVAIAAIVLAVVAAGVNALSHNSLTTVGPWPPAASLFLVVVGLAEIVAFVAVVGGLIWLINPRLEGQQATRQSATVLLLVGVIIVLGFILLHNRPHQEPAAAPSPSRSAVVGSGSPPPVAAPPDLDGKLLLVVAAVALAVIGAILLLRQLRTRTVVAVAPVSPAIPPLAAAARRGRDAVLAGDSSPRAAIIRCFAAMEDALAGRQEVSPRLSDTPVELLERAWRRGLIRPEPARVLLNLFAVARFSDHPMTEDDRTAAAAALSGMLDDLRERTP